MWHWLLRWLFELSQALRLRIPPVHERDGLWTTPVKTFDYFRFNFDQYIGTDWLINFNSKSCLPISNRTQMRINKYFSTVVNLDIYIPPNTPKCCKLKINFFSDFLSDQGGQPRRRLNIYHSSDSSSRNRHSSLFAQLFLFHSEKNHFYP